MASFPSHFHYNYIDFLINYYKIYKYLLKVYLCQEMNQQDQKEKCCRNEQTNRSSFVGKN